MKYLPFQQKKSTNSDKDNAEIAKTWTLYGPNMALNPPNCSTSTGADLFEIHAFSTTKDQPIHTPRSKDKVEIAKTWT